MQLGVKLPARTLTKGMAILTIEMAAEKLNVSYWKVWRLVKAGDIHTVLIGKRKFISPLGWEQLRGRMKE